MRDRQEDRGVDREAARDGQPAAARRRPQCALASVTSALQARKAERSSASVTGRGRCRPGHSRRRRRPRPTRCSRPSRCRGPPRAGRPGAGSAIAASGPLADRRAATRRRGFPSRHRRLLPHCLAQRAPAAVTRRERTLNRGWRALPEGRYATARNGAARARPRRPRRAVKHCSARAFERRGVRKPAPAGRRLRRHRLR